MKYLNKCIAEAPEILKKSLPSTFEKSSQLKVGLIAGASTVVGAGIAVAAAPLVISAVGFTANGIAANSFAASMMSSLGGGATAAGGVVATMQSVGALGTVAGSYAVTAAAAATGAAVGAGVGTAVAARTYLTGGNV